MQRSGTFSFLPKRLEVFEVEKPWRLDGGALTALCNVGGESLQLNLLSPGAHHSPRPILHACGFSVVDTVMENGTGCFDRSWSLEKHLGSLSTKYLALILLVTKVPRIGFRLGHVLMIHTVPAARRSNIKEDVFLDFFYFKDVSRDSVLEIGEKEEGDIGVRSWDEK